MYVLLVAIATVLLASCVYSLYLQAIQIKEV